MAKSTVNRIFEASVTLKLIHGVIEMIAGFILLFVSASHISRFLEFALRREILEDKSDVVVNFILNFAANVPSNTKIFIGLYLVLFGVINFWLSFILLTKKVKQYVFIEIILGLLIFYQVYKFIHSHSLIILSFAIINIVILALIFKYHNSLLDE